MRKSIMIVLCLLLSVTVAVAREIPREKAAATAAAVFRSGVAVGTKAGSTGVQPASLRLVKETPSMYVFENEGGGFVIASADDVAVPVLGYSLEGRFPTDDMPVNMKSLLDWYERVITYARQQGWEPLSDATGSRSDADDEKEVVLHTAPWGQWSPFNDLAPIVDGQKCPSGCVATAQAIIMKYHSYPERGTGELPGYDFEYNGQVYHVDGYALGHTYDWENMPEGARFRTPYQEAQIAQLLYDIGVMSQMSYGPDGSGAGSLSPLLLTRYFGYDKSMRYEDRSFYSDAKWEQLIRDEIDAGRPVFHCGFSPNGGHAFVMDGYKGRYFSINYGWSGGSAWYLLTPVEGHERELTEFNQWQDMVTHIFPDEGNEVYANIMVPDGYFTPFRWNFSEKTIWGGWMWLWDYSVSTVEVDVAFAMFDREDHYKQTLSETVHLIPEEEYLHKMTITLPDRIEDGDQILLARLEADSWIPITQTRPFRIQFDRSRKLPQMISVGHSFGSPGNEASEGDPEIYFDMYKDVWWEIVNVDGLVVADSSMDHNVYSVSYSMLDEDTGLARFEMNLPEGSYKISFRNFDDTLVFTLKL